MSKRNRQKRRQPQPPPSSPVLPIRDQVTKLAADLVELRQSAAATSEQVNEVARAVPNDERVRAMMAEALRAEMTAIQQLTDDCVRVLGLLVTKGVVTRYELNDAVGRRE